MLHPIMPFVTEELWQHIRRRQAGESIMLSPMPEPNPHMVNKEVEAEMLFVQNVIEALRNIRGEMGIAPAQEITLVMNLGADRTDVSVEKYAGYLKRLARVSALSFVHDGKHPKHAASAVVQGTELFVPLEGLIDIEVEKARLNKEIERISGLLKSVQAKLANAGFVAKAPQDVVAKEREKLTTFGETLEKLRRNLAALQ
jgi:valyl-tRNA synthetase